jgi:hypothetical protein
MDARCIAGTRFFIPEKHQCPWHSLQRRRKRSKSVPDHVIDGLIVAWSSWSSSAYSVASLPFLRSKNQVSSQGNGAGWSRVLAFYNGCLGASSCLLNRRLVPKSSLPLLKVIIEKGEAVGGSLFQERIKKNRSRRFWQSDELLGCLFHRPLRHQILRPQQVPQKSCVRAFVLPATIISFGGRVMDSFVHHLMRIMIPPMKQG